MREHDGHGAAYSNVPRPRLQVFVEQMSIHEDKTSGRHDNPVPWNPPPLVDSSTSSLSPGYFKGVVSEADPLVLYKATPWNALGHSRDSRLRIPRPVLLKKWYETNDLQKAEEQRSFIPGRGLLRLLGIPGWHYSGFPGQFHWKHTIKPMICKRHWNSVLSFQGGTYSDFLVFQGGTTQDFQAS